MARKRQQIGRLALIEFVAPYQRTWLKLLWIIVVPILSVSAYIFLRLFITRGSEDNIPPVVYVGIGVPLWFLFKDLFMAPINAVRSRSGLLASTQFPLLVSIFTTVFITLLEFAIRLVFVIPFILWSTQIALPDAAAGLVLISFYGFAFLGLGLLLLPLWSVFPDLYQVTEVLFRYLIFFSLTIFPLSPPPRFDWVISWNPFAFTIDASRQLLLGQGMHPEMFLTGAAAAVILLYAGLFTAKSSDKFVREAIS